MIRKIDNLGRIGIPKTVRESLNLSSDTPLSISWNTEKGEILLQKTPPFCPICGNTQDLVQRNHILICKACPEIIRRDD
jgi:transcriptional pleiotropic regulator of transition state genes